MQISGSEQNATFHQRPASLVKGSVLTPVATRAHLQIESPDLSLLLLGAVPATASVQFSFLGDEFDETNSLTVDQKTTLKTHRLAFLMPTDFKGMP